MLVGLQAPFLYNGRLMPFQGSLTLVGIEVQSGLVSGVAPQAQLSGSSWPSGAFLGVTYVPL